MPFNKWLRIFAVCVIAALVVLSASCSKKKTKPKTVAPMITSTAPMTATVGTLYSYSIIATGNPVPSLSVTGIPAWLTFDGVDLISGTPTAGDIGLSETMTITASNGVAPDAVQTFAITVNPSPASPMITSTAPTMATVGTLYSYAITATGYPVPSLSVTGLPAWLSFDGTDTISGTPTSADIGLSETITITASNGVSPEAEQTFAITVGYLEIAPSITSTTRAAVTVGSLYSYSIITTGYPTPILSVTGLPSWLTFDGTDTISGTPATGNIGLSETITVTATNGINPDAVQTMRVCVYDILYVNISATGLNNGSTWTDAYTNLQDALSLATSGVGNEIWVAQGRYTPTVPNGDRTISFRMAEGKSLYGGFIGTETSRGQRDWILYITILSGDLNGDDIGFTNNGENSHTVVTGCNNVTLDGFTISGGNANGSNNAASCGGGMYNTSASPTVSNNIFSGNSAKFGGGMYNTSASSTVSNSIFSGNTANYGGGMYNLFSSLTLTNCIFIENSANYSGGGMNNTSASPMLTNCIFSGNTSSNGGGIHNYYSSSPTLTNCIFNGNTANFDGGGMFNDTYWINNTSSSPTLTNCTFSENSANSDGGGIYNTSSSPTLTNCTFRGNTATSYGGGICNNYSSSPSLTNCILWGNSASSSGNEIFNLFIKPKPIISYCCIEDCGSSGTGWNAALGIDNGGNTDADPLFLNITDPDGADNIFHTSDDGLNLQSSSPCIDVAHSQPAPQTDILGLSRIDIPGVANTGAGYATFFDIGAYEFNGQTGYTIAGGFNGDLISDIQIELSATSVILGSVNSKSNGHFEFLGIPTGEYIIRPVPVPGCIITPISRMVNVSDSNVINIDFGVTVLIDSQPVIYVNMAATGANDGTSWENAFTKMRYAVRLSESSQEIWVAQGNYCPAEPYPWNRSISFFLKEGISWYGGFAGDETSRDQRNWLSNTTVLTGDLYGDDVGFTNNSENSFNVVFSNGISSATIDGFTITGGNGTNGGGLYNYSSALTLINCSFIGNSTYHGCGGGMYNYLSSPMITNCTFNGNTAKDGGGIYNYHSSPTLTNCIFSGNSANYYGGGMANSSASPMVTNCTFTDNIAYSGGGMINSSSTPTLMNCTFSNNSASSYGGAIFNNDSSSILKNCIVWGNYNPNGTEIYIYIGPSIPIISFCDIKGCGGSGGIWISSIGTDNGNNIDLNPLFVHTPISTRKTTSDGTTTTVIISSASTDFSVSDIIEINNDGTARTITNISSSTITFTPALSAASVANTIVHNWGPGATDLEFNLQLQPSSPCIDAGTSDGAPATDILGVERPQGLEVDMGAYEQ